MISRRKGIHSSVKLVIFLCGIYYVLYTLFSVVFSLNDWFVDRYPDQDDLSYVARSYKTRNISDLNLYNIKEKLFRKYVNMTGVYRSKPGYLTIGIPSIKRQNYQSPYLFQTLECLINHTSREEQEVVTVVVFLASMDTDYKERILTVLKLKYGHLLRSGFLQVLQVDEEYYPSFHRLKHNFQDKSERVLWRSKQAADFAFLYLHSGNKSTYYLQIEDDVLTALNYVSKIRSFILDKRSDEQWTMLEFSELGFIGKLFKSVDLDKLAAYMLIFYEEQPVDWLMRTFTSSMAQKKEIRAKRSLFQHIGKTSSLFSKKENNLQDRFFIDDHGKTVSGNPAAYTFTTLQSYIPTTDFDTFYSYNPNVFWAISPRKGDTVTIIFTREEKLKHIKVHTGCRRKPTDILIDAYISIGTEGFYKEELVALNQTAFSCRNTSQVARFTSGKVNIDFSGHLPLAKCVIIHVEQDQQYWAFFEKLSIISL